MKFCIAPIFVATVAGARPPDVGNFSLRPDCRMELRAAEPDIVSPVGLVFTPREMRDLIAYLQQRE
jgi:hypothetical protein